MLCYLVLQNERGSECSFSATDSGRGSSVSELNSATPLPLPTHWEQVSVHGMHNIYCKSEAYPFQCSQGTTSLLEISKRVYHSLSQKCNRLNEESAQNCESGPAHVLLYSIKLSICLSTDEGMGSSCDMLYISEEVEPVVDTVDLPPGVHRSCLRSSQREMDPEYINGAYAMNPSDPLSNPNQHVRFCLPDDHRGSLHSLDTSTLSNMSTMSTLSSYGGALI